MEIFGLPAHVLIVHGAVVFIPLAVAAAIAFAVFPKWRYLTRWPALLLALVAAGNAWAARITGKSFFDDAFDAYPEAIRNAIQDHESRGEVLSLVVLAFLLLVIFGFTMLGGASGFASGRGAKEMNAQWAELVVPASIVVVGIVTLVYVVLTGDAGSRVVWDPPTS
ncbi:MAG TPA: hypothetical protein VLI04_11195 [Nocardioidaceae bacterium]|nr:hypothetical protein [Nocardioidaceae bacterium]